ncbi:MAG: metal ABC transporter permease [Armatimonadota bacterium]|nr:metal ABC transporter permease [Armatimonadota bacterium]
MTWWSLWSEDFMQRALLATSLAGVACSLMGVLVVTMRLSFLGVCIAHAAFAGALAGLHLNISPLGSALVASLLAAGVLGPIADKGNLSPDTAIGVVFSASMALAFLLLALLPGPRSEALGWLWGNVLTVSEQNLWLLAVTAGAIALLVVFRFKELQALLFHRELAAASGLPATVLFYAVLVCSGAAITASLSAIGGLLVFSMVVNPAATAYQLTYRLSHMFLLSALFAILSGWTGLALSALFNLPSGAMIVLSSTVILLLAVALSPKRRAMAGGKM